MTQEFICATCGFLIEEDELYSPDAEGNIHHVEHGLHKLARVLDRGGVIGGFPDDLDTMITKPQKEGLMSSKKDVKLYLAGPEVFLSDAVEHAEMQRELCRQYGFIGLHPMDNNVDISAQVYETAIKIYHGDVRQVHECDIVVANCNPFRGVLIDDGTAYELGFGNALGKPSYGYVESARSCKERMIDQNLAFWSAHLNAYIDSHYYLILEEFTTLINLMMQCGMTEHGGRLVVGSFEDCLKAIREDLDNGILVLT